MNQQHQNFLGNLLTKVDVDPSSRDSWESPNVLYQSEFLGWQVICAFYQVIPPSATRWFYVHENLRITVTWLKFHLSRSAIAHICSVSFGLFFWVLGNSFALVFASWRVGPNAYLRYLTSSWRLLTCFFSLIFFICLLVFFFQYILGDSKWYVTY